MHWITDNFDNLLEVVFFFVCVAFLLCCGGWMTAHVIDGIIFERRAWEAQTTCEAKRMEYRRKFFTTTVTCVLVNTRQDTTTVNIR